MKCMTGSSLAWSRSQNRFHGVGVLLFVECRKALIWKKKKKAFENLVSCAGCCKAREHRSGAHV